MDSASSSTHHRSGKGKANFGAQVPRLPEEIVEEILARLPVKSLLRFRCVSKSFLALISSQQFIEIHLDRSEHDRNLSNFGIMFGDLTSDIKQSSLSSLMHEPLTDACSIDYPKKDPQKPVLVVGSCNGLFCLVLNGIDVLLWNPSTRESKILPPLNVDVKRCFDDAYGICYIESDNDYKVVGIFCVLENRGPRKSMVGIYSLKSNSWKRIEGFKAGFPMSYRAMFASGKIHWCASDSDIVIFHGWDICSLDMETEVYGIVEQPNYGVGDLESILGVLGGCICVLCNDQFKEHLWVLKEYGVKESWSIVATFPLVVANTGNWCSKPLSILPNGEIWLLSECGRCFVVNNPRENSIRTYEISNVEEADIYVESLVSPHRNGRQNSKPY